MHTTLTRSTVACLLSVVIGAMLVSGCANGWGGGGYGDSMSKSGGTMSEPMMKKGGAKY